MCVQFTVKDTGIKIIVNLYCSSPALFVWLDADDIPGFFDANGFLLISETYTVSFTKWGNTTIQEFTTKLRITSLRDIYWVCVGWCEWVDMYVVCIYHCLYCMHWFCTLGYGGTAGTVTTTQLWGPQVDRELRLPCVKFRMLSCVCVNLLWVLKFPPTSQKYATIKWP